MKLYKKALAGLATSLLAVSALSSPAFADEPEAVEATADFLTELREIEGQPAAYTATPASDSKASISGQDDVSVSPQVAYPDVYACDLFPSVVHVRKSSGYGAVGAKPYTSCLGGSPTYIKHTSTLYIIEWAGLYFRDMGTWTTPEEWYTNFAQQLNVEYWCSNYNSSKFQQYAVGESLQVGTMYYSSVWTRQDTLGCGY